MTVEHVRYEESTLVVEGFSSSLEIGEGVTRFVYQHIAFLGAEDFSFMNESLLSSC